MAMTAVQTACGTNGACVGVAGDDADPDVRYIVDTKNGEALMVSRDALGALLAAIRAGEYDSLAERC